MAKITIAAIRDKVQRHRDATISLRERFDEDYSMARLDETLPSDPEKHEGENEGFHIYTSSDPKNFSKKIISWASSANRIIQIPIHGEDRHKRDIDNQKEQFLIGTLRAADERLEDLGLPPSQDQFAFFGALRGHIIGRALLRKRDDGTTVVDITPWDALHSYWGFGRDGLDWACYVINKTRDEVKAQYGKDIPQESYTDDDRGIEIYDYYDSQINMTFADDGTILKKRTPHGSPRTPVFLGIAGSMPPIQSDTLDDTARDHGESIFEASRQSYKSYNLIMSIVLELVSRARKPPIIFASRSGEKTLDESPYETGVVMSLAEGEKIEAVKLLEMTRDAGTFIGLVSGEIQRGTIPHSAYGDIAFQLSGFAITQLRQGIDTSIQPVLQLIQRVYRQITNLLSDQYATGAFETLKVSGRDNSRKYFELEATPEIIKEGCDPEISLVGNLPQDDMSNAAMAQMLREGPVPLMPDRWIRENKLKVQDSDMIDDAIKEQLGERMVPMATLWSLMVAAEEQGRDVLAEILLDELQMMMIEKQQRIAASKMAAQGMGMPPGMGQGGPGGPPTANPQAAPNAMFGAPPPIPTPQGGPNVPPGSPRPGAQVRIP